MIKDYKVYVEYFLTMDEPVHLDELKIYPLKVKDAFTIFNTCFDVLMIKKNLINDIKVMNMSYLEYLAKVVFKDVKVGNNGNTIGDESKYKFYLLMCKVFDCNPNEVNFLVDNKGKIFLTIKGIKISPKKFDEVKMIILHSNILNYDDRYISPDVQKMKDVYVKMKNKDAKKITLEEQIIFVMRTGVKKSDILDMQYREFQIMYDMLIDEIEYKLNKTAEMSGNVKFKTKIKHFLYGKKADIYDEMFNSVEDVKGKFGV